jgi:hypothetical protein
LHTCEAPCAVGVPLLVDAGGVVLAGVVLTSLDGVVPTVPEVLEDEVLSDPPPPQAVRTIESPMTMNR